MFASLFFVTLFVALFQSVSADFTIDTPTLVQCQGSQITWNGGTGPYDLLIVPADDVCGDSIEDLGNQTSSAMTWTVNIAAGTQVVLSLLDSTGDEAWSGAITVGASSDSSCLTKTSSAPPSGTPLTVPPVKGSSTPPGAAAPSSSAFAPAGAANAGLNPTSGAFSIRPLSAISVIGGTVIAAVAFAL
ncbi:hypothetical protein PAXRUDRAFT_26262 [Paxillus rubicundulus Ve08.2h10]|uniref:Uncharacterized protein n=1 Tax=Paxillus rubicundulus Ve08.2h10 TaxID=930991 RepID=A0A0D0E0V8_9AGAM|nr:hypothetical protein PAXRUDRAFT_26262 [Paxillus rubicundulus Ve08.2h10]